MVALFHNSNELPPAPAGHVSLQEQVNLLGQVSLLEQVSLLGQVNLMEQSHDEPAGEPASNPVGAPEPAEVAHGRTY